MVSSVISFADAQYEEGSLGGCEHYVHAETDDGAGGDASACHERGGSAQRNEQRGISGAHEPRGHRGDGDSADDSADRASEQGANEPPVATPSGCAWSDVGQRGPETECVLDGADRGGVPVVPAGSVVSSRPSLVPIERTKCVSA